MEGNPFAVGTLAQSVREAFAGMRELARVRPVEANAKDLADILAHNLHQEPVGSTQQKRGRLERCEAILGANLLQGTILEVVNPEMCRGLRVILAERPPRAVAPRLHAQNKDAMAVGKDRSGLPRGLAGLVELEVAKTGPIGVHESRLTL
jgi:hypothetical protein